MLAHWFSYWSWQASNNAIPVFWWPQDFKRKGPLLKSVPEPSCAGLGFGPLAESSPVTSVNPSMQRMTSKQLC